MRAKGGACHGVRHVPTTSGTTWDFMNYLYTQMWSTLIGFHFTSEKFQKSETLLNPAQWQPIGTTSGWTTSTAPIDFKLPGTCLRGVCSVCECSVPAQTTPRMHMEHSMLRCIYDSYTPDKGHAP